MVTTINESHFGTSYSSQVTNRSTTFTAGSNSVNYTFTNNNSNNVATEAVSFNNSPAFATAYSYDSNENITSKTITLADNTTFNVVNTYDSKNRITSTGYGSAEQTYTYDQYGQLTQTVDTANGFTETYSYDQRGNILTKTKVYDDTSFPAETTNFNYGNSAWPDELTSVNGTSLTYDANGNVLSYGNMEFEWTNGRVLSQITVNPTDPNGTADVYSYTYDESGIRSSKTVNGATTYFTTKDGVILSQTDGTNTMYFQYDNSGNPTGFLYNGTQYFYLTNQMGDVIGITDNTGSLIATYTYGAWGEVLATTPATAGSSAQLAIANANPLRYRGYYLDAETGYYYLQRRYYNSKISRFINTDDVSTPKIIRTNDKYLNLFSYCGNSPVLDKDVSGSRSKKEWQRVAASLGMHKTQNGFYVYAGIQYLSRWYCLYIGAVAVWAWGNYFRYAGMSAYRMGVEVWAHAVAHFLGIMMRLSGNAKLYYYSNKLFRHTYRIDVNKGERLLPIMYGLWAAFPLVVRAAYSSKMSSAKQYRRYLR